MKKPLFMLILSLFLFTVGCDEETKETCVVLQDRFDEDTVIPKGCYLAQTSPIVADGVKLTLDPGVKIIFSADTRLHIGGSSILDAQGTSSNPILLTADVKERGHWQGLIFEGTEELTSTLSFVTVEYAGSTASDDDGAGIKAIADSRGVSLSLSNSTIRECEGWGLYLTGSAQMPTFENNVLTLNTLGPANVDSEVAGLIDAGTDCTGNDTDEIWVRSYGLSRNGTWNQNSVPWHLSGSLDVTIPWVIAAGSTIILEQDATVSISGDEAAITAIGTESDPILFTGAVAERGYWWSVNLSSNNQDNRIEYVTFEYGGSTAHDANSACFSMIADSRGTTAEIVNSTFRECQGTGLFLTGSANLPTFNNNTFTMNTNGPVNSGSTAVHQLDTTSTYTGNDIDEIIVRSDYIAENVTWEDLGVPYVFDGGIEVNGNSSNPVVWTIAPGVTIVLPAAAVISVAGDYSGLYAAGTADKPITFTGAEKTTGFWKAIRFDGSLNSSNLLDHTVIEYGGSVGGTGEEAMVHVVSDSHGVGVTITNSTLSHSGLYAVYLGLWATVNSDLETSNTFSDNASGNVYREE